MAAGITKKNVKDSFYDNKYCKYENKDAAKRLAEFFIFGDYKYDENFKYFMELDVDHGGIDFSEDEWKEFTEVGGLPQDVLEGARPLMLKKEEEAPVEEPKKEIGLLLKEERKPRKSKKK